MHKSRGLHCQNKELPLLTTHNLHSLPAIYLLYSAKVVV